MRCLEVLWSMKRPVVCTLPLYKSGFDRRALAAPPPVHGATTPLADTAGKSACSRGQITLQIIQMGDFVLYACSSGQDGPQVSHANREIESM